MSTNARSILFVILASVGVCLPLTAAHSAPVLVENFSFETHPPDGLVFPCDGIVFCRSSGLIPGWDVSGATGQFQPGPPDNKTYFNSVPDAVTVAYSDGGTISQVVGETVQLGFTYTLLVEQGVLKGLGDPELGTINLLIGATPILASGTPASPGDWSTYTATYIGMAADVGKTIGIELATIGPQAHWDNVRLDATGPNAVPEPGTLALAGIALLGLGFARRRKNV